METNIVLNNVVIEGNKLSKPSKKHPKIIKKEEVEKEKVEKKETINKKTKAGGANTNYFGKKFEKKTNNQMRLLNNGYTKNSFTKKPKKAHDYYLSKNFEDKTIIFVLQNGLKSI